MNIVYINSEYPENNNHGGIATYTYNIANAIKKMGHNVSVIQKRNMKSDKFMNKLDLKHIDASIKPDLSDRLCEFFFPEIIFQKNISRSYLKYLNRLCLENKLDIVQVPEYNGEGCMFKQKKFKLVLRFHTPTYLVDRLNNKSSSIRKKMWYNIERKTCEFADGMTVSSNALKQIVCNDFNIPEERVKVIRNPVDTDNFYPDFNKKNDAVNILFVGRLEPRKGVEILIKIFPIMLEKLKDIKITIVGHDVFNYKKIIFDACYSNRTRLNILESVKRHDLPNIYRLADIFFMPSFFDNSPNTLFEAMSSNLAVVASNVGGINEIIENNVNGLLFDINENIDSILEKVEYLVENQKKRKDLSDAARKTVKEKYDPDRIAKETIDYYKSI